MNRLKEQNLIGLIKESNKPTLGICIGMQILFDYSQEDDTKCLGIIEGDVKKFLPDEWLIVTTRNTPKECRRKLN